MLIIEQIFTFNIILALLLSAILFNLKIKANKTLATLLLSYSILGFMRLGIYLKSTVILIYMPLIMFPGLCLYGTLIMHYINRTLYNSGVTLKLHLIAPITLFLIHLSILIVVPQHIKVLPINELTEFHSIYSTVIKLLLGLYNITLISIGLIRINHYRVTVKERFSRDLSKDINRVFMFIILNAIFLSYKIISIFLSIITRVSIPFNVWEDIAVLSILLSIIYFLITKPQFIPVIKADTQNTKTKYEKVYLSDRDRKLYAKRLLDLMEEKKEYLNDELTLNSIADELSIPQHLLSMTINLELKQNFFNFINSYRVNHAKELLQNPEESKETILNIAYKSGFQSKSSFNKYFKKYTGLTPSEFKKQML